MSFNRILFLGSLLYIQCKSSNVYEVHGLQLKKKIFLCTTFCTSSYDLKVFFSSHLSEWSIDVIITYGWVVMSMLDCNGFICCAGRLGLSIILLKQEIQFVWIVGQRWLLRRTEYAVVNFDRFHTVTAGKKNGWQNLSVEEWPSIHCYSTMTSCRLLAPYCQCAKHWVSH